MIKKPFGLAQGKKMVRLGHSAELSRSPHHKISAGTVHGIPADLRKILTSTPSVLAAWEDLTPLARNEWICWVISVKKQETRNDHVRRVRTELMQGKRRPCCWIGCIHRSK